MRQRFVIVVPAHAVQSTGTTAPTVSGVLPRTGAGPLLAWLLLLAVVLIAVGTLLVVEARARR
jgi:hypothetical protein